MTFLEAKAAIAALTSAEPLPFLLAMSGTPDQLDLFVRGHAARAGVAAQPRVLPFGTLGQAIHQGAETTEAEVILLMPWDLALECDWRSGMGGGLTDLPSVLDGAGATAARLAGRPNARFLYLAAPLPPLFATARDNGRLAAGLAALAANLGATILPAAYFSLASYLASGCPIGGKHLSATAQAVVSCLLAPAPGSLKVLVTDADNTLWSGLVGEDGIDAVVAEPQGRGFRHFIYQTLLARLRRSGVLLAVVSRNDDDVVRAPLASGRMPLGEDAFVAICAGYGVKSDHIRNLAQALSLGLDSFVFVDDNPVELAEVGSALPQVTCLAFPTNDEQFPEFCTELGRLFDRPVLTAEDGERTELYRRRLATAVPQGGSGGDVTGFLAGLRMVLTIHDRSREGSERALQLINKTNQFNLNGLRLKEDELIGTLAEGGRLYTATLEDRAGSHGEILACLITADGTVRSLVMSCRVLQRRVEFAFLAWLAQARSRAPLRLAFAATERNEPLRRFLDNAAFVHASDAVTVDVDAFLATHGADAALFTLRDTTQ